MTVPRIDGRGGIWLNVYEDKNGNRFQSKAGFSSRLMAELTASCVSGYDGSAQYRCIYRLRVFPKVPK